MEFQSITQKVKELWRDTRGGYYVYVLEDKELVHISEYGKKLPGKHEDEIIYEVPKDKLKGKSLYIFDFSRRGRAFLCKCSIEDFDENGTPKHYEYFNLLEEHIRDIQSLRFRIKDAALLSLQKQFEQLFVPMIQEIKEYQKEKNFEIYFSGRAERLKDVFVNSMLYYFTSMCLPDDKSRIKSLKVIRRWIYQIWVLKLVCEAFQVIRFKREWQIEQGSEYSTIVAETPFGDITMWLEFQLSKGMHELGACVQKKIKTPLPTRPDIVVVRGYFEFTKDFAKDIINSDKFKEKLDLIMKGSAKFRKDILKEIINSDKAREKLDLIIECKEDPFNEWKNKIESQIIPYREFFEPKNFILASLETIPEYEKKHLESQGIKVVDNLRIGSESINILINLIRQIFGT